MSRGIWQRAAALAAVAMIITTTGVFAADDAVLDPDGATPFTEDSSSPSFDLGDICQNTPVSHDVLVKAQNGNGSSWANSAVLTLAANSGATGTDAADMTVGVGSPNTITLPATWTSAVAGTLSTGTAIGKYTVSSAALGAHTANADWTLTGAQSTTGTLTGDTPNVHVDWNVIDCNTNALPSVEAGATTYSGGEGSPIALNGASATDSDGTITSTLWEITSASVGTGSCSLTNTSSVTAATISCTDNGTAIVKLTATDNDGATAFDTANVTISNVAPTATFNSPSASVNEGTTFGLSLSGATDASSIDAATLTYAFDCGAGYGAFGAASSITCSSATDGPANLSVAGTVRDKDGGETPYTASVTVANVPPSVPGTPSLSAGVTPNNTGEFALSWTASTDAGGDAITYTLLHTDANDLGVYSTVASGLTSASYAFSSSSPEGEGTWTYVVYASDEDGASSVNSGASSQIVVDKTAPLAPTVSADRVPDYAGGGGWYKDTVTVSSDDNGDPSLADGSAGTGVDSSSVRASEAYSTSGSHAYSDTVLDNVTNESSAGSLTVQVDATAPSVSFGTTCPGSVVVGSSVSISWTASDDHSGLTGASSGSVALDTTAPTLGNPAPRTASLTVYDNVGHSATATCTYGTAQAIFYAPIDGPSVLNVAKAGRVIPVKVDILVNGTELVTAPVYILVNKLSSCTATTEDSLETYAAAGASNVGNLFRWDTAGAFWIYNLDTSANGMAANNCYRGNVYFGGTADINGKYGGGTLAGYFLIKLAK